MKRRGELISVILVLLFIFGCAGMRKKIGEMTPLQKYDMYRTTFNNVIEHQYLPWAIVQPEETKVKLRTEVNDLIKKAEGALDLYGQSVKGEIADPEAKLEFYLKIKNELYVLLLKYGLKIDESKRS